MSKELLQKTRRKAYKFVAMQAMFVILAALVATIATDVKAGYSVILGGLTSIGPTLYFTYKLFKRMGASSARAIIRNFYLGEVIKLALMGLLFVTFIKLGIVTVLPFALGFVIAQIAALIAPFWYGIEPT